MRARWGWKPQPVRADRAQAEGRGGGGATCEGWYHISGMSLIVVGNTHLIGSQS